MQGGGGGVYVSIRCPILLDLSVIDGLWSSLNGRLKDVPPGKYLRQEFSNLDNSSNSWQLIDIGDIIDINLSVFLQIFFF